MTSFNPYQPPSANLAPEGAAVEGLQVTSAMLEHLRGTKPWVRFIAVMGFVGCSLMIIGGLFIVAAGALSGGGGDMPAWMGVLYVFMALLYFFPSLFLNRYATAIAHLLERGQAPELETALRSQRSFWRLIGIVMIVALCLWVLVIIGAMVAGIAAAMSTGI